MVGSAYFRMPTARRDAVKSRARERYQGPAGVIQRRSQYLKALRSGLINRAHPRTLARHGIEWDEAGGWVVRSDVDGCEENVCY